MGTSGLIPISKENHKRTEMDKDARLFTIEGGELRFQASPA